MVVIQLQKLIFIFMRITSFIVICPGFSQKSFPNTVKIAVSIGLSVMVYAITPEVEIVENVLYFSLLALKEIALGLALGFVTNLIFSSVQIAGQLVDFQAGFSMATTYDPMTGTSASNYGKLYYWMAISIFFILDLHHIVIESLIKSFEYIPVTSVDFGKLNVEGVMELFGVMLETALNLVAPLIIVLLATDIILGVISKTVPQINVLILGMPLKAMVSFVFLLLILTWLAGEVGDIVSSTIGYLNRFINSFR